MSSKEDIDKLLREGAITWKEYLKLLEQVEKEERQKKIDAIMEDDFSGHYLSILSGIGMAGREIKKSANSKIISFLCFLIGSAFLVFVFFDAVFYALERQQSWDRNLDEAASALIGFAFFYLLGAFFWIREMVTLFRAGHKLEKLDISES